MVCFRYIIVNTLHKGDGGGDYDLMMMMMMIIIIIIIIIIKFSLSAPSIHVMKQR